MRRARLMNIESPDYEYLKLSQTLDADTDQTRALIDELIRMGTSRFLFSGNGEPFLHKSALGFMARVKHAGCNCVVNTNGTLLDRATIDELIKMGFDELRITVMAGTREMYLKTHPGSKETTFDDLTENLLYLADRKYALGVKRPKVSLVFVVVAQNYDGLVDFANLATLVRAARVLFLPVDDVGDLGLRKLVPTTDEAAGVREQLNELRAHFKSKGIDHNINNFLKVFREQLDTASLYRVIPCYNGWTFVRVEVDGGVYPCCRCYDPLGNVYQKEFKEIWHGPAYRQFRKDAVHINRRGTPVTVCDCNSCPHHTANLRVYRSLHPLRGRSTQLEGICPAASEEEER